MNVTYVGGAGRLGLPIAVWSAYKGNPTVIYDLNAEKLKKIESGTNPNTEPIPDDVWQQARHNLITTTNIEEAAKSTIIFIIVNTPSQPDGQFDIDAVLDVCEKIGPHLDEYKVVTVVSTINPGDTQKWVKLTLESSSGRDWPEFGIAYSPEFVRQGSIVRDFANPDVVLMGTNGDDLAAKILTEYYQSVTENNPKFITMSWASAEIAKLGLNSFLGIKIQMTNQIAWLCHKTPGASARDVLRSIGSDHRIGHDLLRPGTPAGGPCLPRDNVALAAAAKRKDIDNVLASSVGDSIDGQLYDMAAWIDKCAGRIGILGLAFKPGTDVTGASPGLELAQILTETFHREVIVYDPLVNELEGIVWPASLDDIIEHADVIVIANPDPAFSSLTEYDLTGKTVIDIWGMFGALKLSANHVRFGEHD